MKHLLEKLEAAEEGSRELDAYISATIKNMLDQDWQDPRWGEGCPHYTTSLDAALTLVPEGWTAWELFSRRAKTRFVAVISRLPEDSANEEDVTAHAPTPALALCIAALRAREAA